MRPSGLLRFGLAFAAGVGGWFLQTRLPPTPAVLALAGLCAGLTVTLVLLPKHRLRRARTWLLALAMAGLGFGWAHLAVCERLCAPFPPDLLRADLIAVGRIADLPEVNADAAPQSDRETGATPGNRAVSARFLFDIEHLSRDGEPLAWRGRVRLSWYREPPPLRAGERWQLPVRLKASHGFINPGGFDYEGWLFQQGVVATGYIRDGAELLAVGPDRYWLARARQGLRDRLDAVLGQGIGGALVTALVLGDRGGLTPPQWEVLARTGTSHLVAISGLHVGLVAGFVFVVARWLWSRSARLALLLAAPRAAAVAALLAAFGYSALAGFAISTQRALVMLAVLLLAVIAGRVVRPASGLVLALVAVLLLDPIAVLSYGFWLSFGAVAVLFFALARRLGPAGLLWRWGGAQWAVALGLLPMLLLFFGRASLVAPAVNLIAVPLFGLLLPVILGATLVTLSTGWEPPLLLVGWLLELGFTGLEGIAGASWSAVALSARAPWVWAAAFFGALLLLAPRGLPGRWLGLVLLLPLVLQRPTAPPPGNLAVTVLDVGQGLAVVLQTAHHALVYDTGPAYPSGFNTGSAVVAPTLQHLGIRALDLLVISHADIDHAGGLVGLARALPVARLLTGEPAKLTPTLGEAGLDLVPAPCRAGQRWVWDGVHFEMLHPTDDRYSGNNASCVLRVEVGGTVTGTRDADATPAPVSLLLTGDIEARVERELVAAMPARLASTVLIAGHHGSATSTTAAMLDAVAPALVIYTAGYANRWGFPATAVRERVAERGIPSLDTQNSGAISLRLGPDAGPDGLDVPIAERERRNRPWRHHPAAGP